MISNLNIAKRIIFLSFILISLGINANAQESRFNKNAVYLSYGNIIFSDQVSITYERSIFEKNIARTKLKAVLGNYLSHNADYEEGARKFENYLGLSGVQLIGLLEINAGLAFATYRSARGFNPLPNVNYDELKNDLIFYGSLGWRYEKNRFLIRGGINNIELLYLGIGVTF